MTFVSYAQNFEDVILSRAFKDVNDGFYIDVGAGDPVVESVTKAFYERGWRGINIEPVSQYYRRLCQERPADINLPLAAGAEDGAMPYYEIPGTGFSTLDQAVAEQHRQQGRIVTQRKISVIPLSVICRQFAKAAIHFLKVDVEGAERQVLLGMDFRQYRPWVVVVAVWPHSREPQHAQWEGILLEYGYQFVYFDGINRFYVAGEKAARLKASFLMPPNYFDEFQSYAEYLLQQDNSRLQQENRELKLQNHVLREELCRTHTSDPAGICPRLCYPENEPQRQAALLTEQLRLAIWTIRNKAKLC